MATFGIETEICLGMSHYGGVYEKGTGTIELSDDEVDCLVDLLRNNPGITDYSELGLEKENPELFNKIDEVYRHLAYKTEILHWVTEGLEQDEWDFDVVEAMEYCEEHCGFDSCYSGDIRCSYLKIKEFIDWFENSISDFDYDDISYLYFNLMDGDMDHDEDEMGGAYTCELPEKLIKQAKQ